MAWSVLTECRKISILVTVVEFVPPPRLAVSVPNSFTVTGIVGLRVATVVQLQNRKLYDRSLDLDCQGLMHY